MAASTFRSMIGLGALLAVLGVASVVGAASPATPSLPARGARVMKRGAEYRAAPRATRAAVRRELRAAAEARHRELVRLLEQDPAQALAAVLPATAREVLPRAARHWLEVDVELEGELEVLVEDAPGRSTIHYTLVGPRGRRHRMYFAGEPPELPSGSRVRVHGVRIGGVLALGSAESSVAALLPATPNTLGPRSTAVILVNFEDARTQPYTAAYARDVVFGTTSRYIEEASYGQTWLTGDVLGWYTIALSSTTCDSGKIASLARSAASGAGVDLSRYAHFVYAFPRNACSWWGLGSVGAAPSNAWINGTLQLGVVAHEFGHNLGLYHSQALECGSVPVGPSCTTVEYGDTLDMMGASLTAHFNAFQKARLGWLDAGASPPITAVATDGSYAIDAFQTPGTTPKALAILKSIDPATNRRTWYFVEYRAPVGFDDFLAGNANVTGGVVVHTGSEASGRSSHLLDMTPETPSWNDPALGAARTFVDPDSGVSITPIAAGGGGATVRVGFGPVACVRAAPTVTMTAASGAWAAPGGTLVYDVTMASTDGMGCAAAQIDLATSVPAGWGAALDAAMVSVAPGATAMTGLRITVPAAAAAGSYPIAVTARHRDDPALAATTTTSAHVVTTLGVAVLTDRTSYTRNQTISIAAAVSAAGAAVSGAPVTFTLIDPLGGLGVASGTSDASGVATWRVRLKRRDPTGVYRVIADTAMAGLAARGEATFTVR